MDNNNGGSEEQFMEAMEAASVVLQTLKELNESILNQKSASASLATTRDDLLKLINPFEHLVEKLNEVVTAIKTVDGLEMVTTFEKMQTVFNEEFESQKVNTKSLNDGLKMVVNKQDIVEKLFEQLSKDIGNNLNKLISNFNNLVETNNIHNKEQAQIASEFAAQMSGYSVKLDQFSQDMSTHNEIQDGLISDWRVSSETLLQDIRADIRLQIREVQDNYLDKISRRGSIAVFTSVVAAAASITAALFAILQFMK